MRTAPRTSVAVLDGRHARRGIALGGHDLRRLEGRNAFQPRTVRIYCRGGGANRPQRGGRHPSLPRHPLPHEPVDCRSWPVTGSDPVLRTALDQARLREAPLLMLTTSATGAENTTSDADDQGLHTELAQRLANAGQEDGGVEICDISMPTSLLDFLAPSTNIFQLVVCRKR